MQLFHCSPAKEIKINAFGRFGSFLFFASSACHYGENVFSIELSKDSVIDCKSFFYREDCALLNEEVQEVMGMMDCDEDAAQEYLSQRLHADDAELDWDIQKLTAQCAKKLGFRAVEVPDEHGTSWMVDMLGFENELVKQ